MLAVKTTDLTKKYGKYSGIESVNLLVEAGDIFGIVGGEGAGKTTLLRLLMNFIFPTKGEGNIFGFDIAEESVEIKEIVGYVPSDVTCYPQMKASKYIKTAMKMHKVKDNKLYRELVANFDIPEKEIFSLMDRSDLKATGLVSALAVTPKLLLLDEPFKDLDKERKNTFIKYLLKKNEAGMTIIITDRDFEELDKFCHRIAMMKHGEISEIIEHNGEKYIPIAEQEEDDFEHDHVSTEDTNLIASTSIDEEDFVESDFEEIEDDNAFDEIQEDAPEYEEQSIEDFLADDEDEEAAAPEDTLGILDEVAEVADTVGDLIPEAEVLAGVGATGVAAGLGATIVAEMASDTAEEPVVEEGPSVEEEIFTEENPLTEEEIFAEEEPPVEDKVFVEEEPLAEDEVFAEEATSIQEEPSVEETIEEPSIVEYTTAEKIEQADQIKVVAKRFNKKAFEDMGMAIVEEEKGKVKLAYSGTIEDLAKTMKEMGFENYTISNPTLADTFMSLQQDPPEETIEEETVEEVALEDTVTENETAEPQEETKDKGGEA